MNAEQAKSIRNEVEEWIATVLGTAMIVFAINAMGGNPLNIAQFNEVTMNWWQYTLLIALGGVFTWGDISAFFKQVGNELIAFVKSKMKK